jgi:hypothetical protein
MAIAASYRRSINAQRFRIAAQRVRMDVKCDATSWPPTWGGLISLILISLTSCSATSSGGGSVEASSSAAARTAASPGPGGTQQLDPGGLEAGTRYVIDSLGVSVQPDVDGWFAVLPQGGDAAMSREDVTVYFLLPDTVLDPDGMQVAAPADPQALVDAMDATSIITVTASEPFTANAISGLSAEVTGSGGHVSLLTTGSRSYGLADGQFQLIAIELDGQALVVSIERSDEPDIEAAWEIAGPLVESLDVAE